jgi:arsenate reductase-like glutaredoxin family protein
MDSKTPKETIIIQIKETLKSITRKSITKETLKSGQQVDQLIREHSDHKKTLRSGQQVRGPSDLGYKCQTLHKQTQTQIWNTRVKTLHKVTQNSDLEYKLREYKNTKSDQKTLHKLTQNQIWHTRSNLSI